MNSKEINEKKLQSQGNGSPGPALEGGSLAGLTTSSSNYCNTNNVLVNHLASAICNATSDEHEKADRAVEKVLGDMRDLLKEMVNA